MTLVSSWAPYFRHEARQQGRQAHARGEVQRTADDGAKVVQAKVVGQETHRVTLDVSGQQAKPHCTCDDFAAGHFCSHLWAVLIDLEQSGEATPLDGPVPMADDEGPDEPSPADVEGEPSASSSSSTSTSTSPSVSSMASGSQAPALPKARRKSPTATRTIRREPEWVGRLTLMGPGRHAAPAASGPLLAAQQQICYVVRPDLSGRHDGLVVELRQRTPIAAGWSRPKPLKLSFTGVSDLPTVEDRRLCALLLGATWVTEEDRGDRYQDERGRTCFRLRAGAWRAMLRQMIDTGRCFIDAEEGAPQQLVWQAPVPPDADHPEPRDAPWVLWVVGRLDHEMLRVTPELRRPGGVMDVLDPDLLLGGRDGVLIANGVAAAFDDGGAVRWATQFRDDALLHGEARSIEAPIEEIPRFLDRLYAMPALPELDLPQGLAQTPIRIEPRGELDLFSPDPAGGQSGRKLLTAQIAFRYGDVTVHPQDPGRFVVSLVSPDAALVQPDGADRPVASEAVASEAEAAPAATGDSGDDAAQAQERESVDAIDEQAPSSGDAGDARLVIADDGDRQRVLLRRDLEAESRAISLLVELGFRDNPNEPGATLVLPSRQVSGAVGRLMLEGWRVRADASVIRQPGPPRLSITSGVDWFELRGTVSFETPDGAREVTLPQILAAARAGKSMIDLGDGMQGLLPEAWLREQGLLSSLGEVQGDHLRFRSSQAALLDALLERQPEVRVDETFRRARESLRDFKGVKPVEPAATFEGHLRPYQSEGLGWLDFLQHFGMGGILADDMGLGKTVQVLAMLDRHYHRRAVSAQTDRDRERHSPAETPSPDSHRPSLVVAPRSVLFNWIDEASRFAPTLRIASYTGVERQVIVDQLNEYDLVITSYGLMRRDIELLSQHAFEYAILDEAQAIKNPTSQAAKAARLIRANHRLALTGTPVENHLGDLWSIFEYLNPGMLGSNTRFARLIRETGPKRSDDRLPDGGALIRQPDPTLATGAAAASAASSAAEPLINLSRALSPFILRRTKRQVLADLPEKTEQTIYCEMEDAQLATYEELRRHYRTALLGSGASSSGLGGAATMMVLEALLRLRQAACHPGLIDPKRVGEPSAKLEALLESVTELVDEGHKALVFSQFTSMLDIVRQRFDAIGLKYAYLDGQTSDRRGPVERFQNDPDCPVFLISLKAGGLGLNLTAAEYVFILDPWWNPAVEQQAIDRAHRIGQTRHVFAYRMICRDTVEQRIADLQRRKQRLADAIVGGDNDLLRQLSRDDLEALLS